MDIERKALLEDDWATKHMSVSALTSNAAMQNSLNMTPSQQQDYQEVSKSAKDVIADVDLWLDTPHFLLGGKKPLDLIVADKKQTILDLIGAIREGMFT